LSQIIYLRIFQCDTAVRPVEIRVDALVTRTDAVDADITPQRSVLWWNFLRPQGLSDIGVLSLADSPGLQCVPCMFQVGVIETEITAKRCVARYPDDSELSQRRLVIPALLG
jgi:hypothetical protein